MHVPNRHLRDGGVFLASRTWLPLNFITTKILISFAARQVQAMLSRYITFYNQNPYLASFFTCLFKGGVADSVAQIKVEQRGQLDARRTALFALWSATYCGCAQHFIFNILFRRVFGAGTGFRVALSKASADSFVATPLLGIPIYYACKPMIEGKTGASPLDGLREYAGIFTEFYFKPAMVVWRCAYDRTP